MKIAIAILARNNEKTIKECLNSLEGLNNKKIYYTTLSDDNTESYLKKYIKIDAVEGNACKNKNNLIKNIEEEWILSIEPWEEIINGHNIINQINHGESYKVMVLDQEVINKSIRIFKKNKLFQNEVYEEIHDKNSKISNILFKKNPYNIGKEKEEIELWIKKNKTNPKPYYYMSCYHLKNKNYIDFKKTSERYLFLEENKNLPSVVMTKYYQSLIELHVYKNFKNSTNNIIYCLNNNPSMAEFWCVLGDINFKLNKYQKAIYFYQNAIMFGEKRKSDDNFSIEIKKYKTYPEEMIKICEGLIN
jgi:hypothetical protein